MCHHHLVLVSWTIGISTYKATNLQRRMSRNSKNFSSDAVPYIGKVKLKFFLNSESYDLRTELLVRGVNELEAAYVLV